MLDLFKAYKGFRSPGNVSTLAENVLSQAEDKELQDLFCFFLVLNADKIQPKNVYQKLSGRLKPLFVVQYNRAYLISRIWSRLIFFTTGKRLHLANLFLSKKVQDNPVLFYKIYFNGSRRRLEKRWREILSLC